MNDKEKIEEKVLTVLDRSVSGWSDTLDARDQDEIQLCRYYANTTAHGTPGHLRMALIAKLADMLDEAGRSKPNGPG